MSTEGIPESAAFSEVLAEVRHDLRTPAGHLIGYSEMMVEDLEDEDRTCGVEDLKAIYAEGQKLVELIDELLGVSRTHISDLDLPQIQKELSRPLVEVERCCGRVKQQFEDALTEAKKTGRPDMLMYRKMSEPMVSLTNRQDILDRLDQKERLEAFIKQWFTSPDGESIAGVFHAFQTVEELDGLVENHLRKLANQHLAAAVTDSPVESER